MEKLLSIAVPCYNAEWCLDKCLASFLAQPAVMDKLQVIVINDGSTDNTLEIASRYANMHPFVFSVIDKENGGHGSGINAAMRVATGKYFKAVDADDWVRTENLQSFLDILELTQADVVVTHFETVDMVSGERKEYKTSDLNLGQLYTLNEYTATTGDIYSCTVFHGLTFLTELYKNSGTILSEGIFYEDQEYATLPFVNVQTILPLDMFLYKYLVGNANQSVADLNQVKRLSHAEQVLKRLFACYHDNQDISQGARRYIAWKTIEMLLSYYVIALVKNPDKKGGRDEALRIRREMSALEPGLVESADKKFKLAMMMNRLGFTSKTLDLMKRPLPYAVYRKLFKKNRG